MFNPPDAFPSSGSYDDLLKRITRRVQEDKIADHILELLQRAFERELGKENVTLSRPERKRLFQQVAASMLSDVLGKIGGTK
jgi:hypothetical protein